MTVATAAVASIAGLFRAGVYSANVITAAAAFTVYAAVLDMRGTKGAATSAPNAGFVSP